MDNIKQFFSSLSLSSQEAIIVEELISNGTQSVLQLSRSTKINRVSLYRVLENLKKRDLVIHSQYNKKHLYSPPPINIFEELIERKQAKTLDIAKEFLAVFPKIERMYDSRSNEIKVTHYTGAEQARELCWNSLKTKEILKSFGYSSMRQSLGIDFLVKWWNETIERGITTRMIANPETYPLKSEAPSTNSDTFLEANDLFKRRYLLTESFPIITETFIYNDIYAVLHWDNTNIFGVEIQHPQIAKQQEIIFDDLWEQAKLYLPNKDENIRTQ